MSRRVSGVWWWSGWRGRSVVSVLALALTACDYTPVETSVAVFVDVTEIEERGQQLLTNDTELARIVALVTDREDVQGRQDGGDVTFYVIDDHRLLGRGQRVSLETASWFENEYSRLADIDSFAETIRDTYTSLVRPESGKVDAETQTYAQTFIVNPVCQYFSQLSKLQPSLRRQVVLFYSDLLEHSSVASFYTVPPSVMAKNRDDVVGRFLEVCHDVDLTVAVSYELIQQPLTVGESDQKHFVAKGIWQTFLSQLGLVERSSVAYPTGGWNATD